MIVIYENKTPLSPMLSKEGTSIIESSYSKPLVHALNDDREKIRDYIKVVVSQAKIRGGFKVEDWSEHEITTFLNDCLRVMQRFGGLGVNEIEIIFFKGMTGDYGQNFGLNLDAVNRWFKGYCEQDRAELVKEQGRYLRQLEKEADYEKSKKLREESYARSKEAIEKLRGNGDPGQDLKMHPIYYDYLNAIGELTPSNQEKNELYKKFKEEISHSRDMEIRKKIIHIAGYAKAQAIIKSKDQLFRKYITNELQAAQRVN